MRTLPLVLVLLLLPGCANLSRKPQNTVHGSKNTVRQDDSTNGVRNEKNAPTTIKPGGDANVNDPWSMRLLAAGLIAVSIAGYKTGRYYRCKHKLETKLQALQKSPPPHDTKGQTP